MTQWSLLIVIMGFAGTLSGAALSGCVPNSPFSSSFTCDLFEENSTGGFSEIGWVITLPEGTFPGANIPILEPGTTDASNRANWSDLLVLTATTAQLLSDGCNSGIEGDISCFPIAPISSAAIETPPITTFDTVNGLTIHWRIHEDTGDAADIPEPTTITLLSFGLIVLVVLASRSRFVVRRS